MSTNIISTNIISAVSQFDTSHQQHLSCSYHTNHAAMQINKLRNSGS